MHNAASDQAEGLRRMFGGNRLRVLALAAGKAGVGRRTIAANLAAALARTGRAVLLADCETEPRGALAALGLVAGSEGASAVIEGHGIETALVRGPDGLSALRLGTLPRDARALAVAESLMRISAGNDYLVLNCPDPAALGLIDIEPDRLDIVVVLSRAAASITEAYALVKRMHATWSHRRFLVLVNRVDSEAEANAIFGNMARVAQGYLSVNLELLGWIPGDECLTRAGRLGRAVFDAWPDAPSSAAIRRLAEDISGVPTASGPVVADFPDHVPVAASHAGAGREP